MSEIRTARRMPIRAVALAVSRRPASTPARRAERTPNGGRCSTTAPQRPLVPLGPPDRRNRSDRSGVPVIRRNRRGTHGCAVYLVCLGSLLLVRSVVVGCRGGASVGGLGGGRAAVAGSCGTGGGEVRGRFGVLGVMNRCGETQI